VDLDQTTRVAAADVEAIVALMRRINIGIKHGVERRLEPTGLTLPQMATLGFILEDATVPPTLGRISHHLALAASTVSGIVNRLEREGLVRRRPDPEDGRAIRVEPTARSRELQARIRHTYRAYLSEVLRSFSSGQVAELRRLLERLAGAVERGPDPGREEGEGRHATP